MEFYKPERNFDNPEKIYQKHLTTLIVEVSCLIYIKQTKVAYINYKVEIKQFYDLIMISSANKLKVPQCIPYTGSF